MCSGGFELETARQCERASRACETWPAEHRCSDRENMPGPPLLLLLLVLSSPPGYAADSEWGGQKCAPPEMALDGVAVTHRTDFSDVMEVKFSGAIGPVGERRLCKIKCIEGEWVGPLCQVKGDGGRFYPLFRSCLLEALPPQLLVTYRNVSVV
ncbi:hypothetical protein B566_EDAN005916, partial [Ephemera danica]